MSVTVTSTIASQSAATIGNNVNTATITSPVRMAVQIAKSNHPAIHIHVSNGQLSPTTSNMSNLHKPESSAVVDNTEAAMSQSSLIQTSQPTQQAPANPPRSRLFRFFSFLGFQKGYNVPF